MAPHHDPGSGETFDITAYIPTARDASETSVGGLASPATPGQLVVFARYKPGLVGESRRISHVLTVPTSPPLPSPLTALCGQTFPPNVLELLPAWAGMPCLRCTLNMPTGDEPT